MSIFKSLFRSRSELAPAFESQLSLSAWPAAIYAIGDVHGCLSELRALEAIVTSDPDQPEGDKLIVMLGDYVDRGPNSAGVIDHLLRPLPQGWRRICLAGNHEEMMLEAIRGNDDQSWLEFGGVETLRSYGVDADAYRAARPNTRTKILQSHLPQDHVNFLGGLAVSLQIDKTVFVHAGIRRGVAMDSQLNNDLMWIRREFLDAEASDGLLVVHGHTPTEEPQVVDGRIGIDTGAFATGRLTAVKITQAEPPVFFTTIR